MLQINRLDQVDETTGELQIPYDRPFLLAAKVFVLEESVTTLHFWRESKIIQTNTFHKKSHFFILHPPAQSSVRVSMKIQNKQEAFSGFESAMEWYVVDADYFSKPFSYRLKIPCTFEFSSTLPATFAQIQLKIWPQRKSALLANRSPFISSNSLRHPTRFEIRCNTEAYCYQFRYKFVFGNEVIATSPDSPIFRIEPIQYENYVQIDRDYLEATHKARLLQISKENHCKVMSNDTEWVNIRQVKLNQSETVSQFEGFPCFEQFYTSELNPNESYAIQINDVFVVSSFSYSSDIFDNGKFMEFVEPRKIRPEYMHLVAQGSDNVQDYFFENYIRIGRNGIFLAVFGEEVFRATYHWLGSCSMQIDQIEGLLYCQSKVKEWENEDFSYIKDVFGVIVTYLQRRELQSMRGVCKFLYSISSVLYMKLKWSKFGFSFRGTNLLDKNTTSVYSLRY